ncbi:MAG: hypothetical protein HY959_13850 [Ignavibacteriae bacterium]|nr:hypothetical protein [Ignavibacteriota bacterium]
MKKLIVIISFLFSSLFLSCSAPEYCQNDYSYIMNCPPDSDGIYRPYIISLSLDSPFNAFFDIKCESVYAFNLNDTITNENYNAFLAIKNFKVLQFEFVSKKFSFAYETYLMDDFYTEIPMNYVSYIVFYGRNMYFSENQKK